MRNLFKRNSEGTAKQSFFSIAAKKLAEKTARVQYKAALWLTNQSEKVSPGRKKLALLIYCICFGGLSILIVVQTLYFQVPRQVIVIKSPIPPHIGKAEKQLFPSVDAMSLKTYQELSYLMQLMDSLS